MLKAIVTLVLAAVFFLLTVQNLEPVAVYLLIGRPVSVPLIVVALVCFLLGCIVTILTVVRKAVKRSEKRLHRVGLPVPHRDA